MTTNGFPREARDRRGEQPVRVDEIRAERAARRTRPPHRDEHERRQPGLAPDVRRHPAAVREAEVPIAGTGREHLDLHPALAQPLHGVGDEATGELPLRPRPRRREDDDAHLRERAGRAHGRRTRRTARARRPGTRRSNRTGSSGRRSSRRSSRRAPPSSRTRAAARARLPGRRSGRAAVRAAAPR